MRMMLAPTFPTAKIMSQQSQNKTCIFIIELFLSSEVKINKEQWDTKDGELRGTPDACNWLRENLLGEKSKFDLKVVTGMSLSELKAKNMRITGRGDVLIGKKDDFNVPVNNPFQHAYGIIELKMCEYNLKNAQYILELMSLTQISRVKKNVTLLATDCNKKWELYYFKSDSIMVQRGYKHGHKCWEDFMKLLLDADTK
jgi:hypothetical protein